ncbi:hypothetical protein BOTBODRAFT_328918 [Botryobasidium botryosum FD-172 SS1]|uniref:RRM domain-containing protein n=1 Tax=Botryobasidium botryosum (strain FD-172 SS1) TaxID=930990 RepID=A0A067NBE7_BOTB1|nr:hypothetical protein BOTBODRAFT_328918 [Botryobasidium botryosum FD-172 SS1]
MHSQHNQPQHLPDSPPYHHLSNLSPHTEPFNPSHSMLSSYYTTSEHENPHMYSSASFRPAFPTRTRQPSLFTNASQPYPTAADIFGPPPTQQLAQETPIEVTSLGIRSFDFHPHKQQSYATNGLFSGAQQPSLNKQSTHPMLQHQQGHGGMSMHLNHARPQLHQQSQANAESMMMPNGRGTYPTSAGMNGHTALGNGINSVNAPLPQEEISTIFVVGFPDDMQEREFQNMFTFSPGFEAATLRPPLKDVSAHGPASGTQSASAAAALRNAGLFSPSFPGSNAQAFHSGASDPYNLLAVNSGGVVVDAWPGVSVSTRKQAIGFAKFRSRQEALDALDVLQGRRVDVEKGAVLKAEMAKKNLHTKRGVGPLGWSMGGVVPLSQNNANLPTSGSGAAPNEALSGMGINGFSGMNSQSAVNGAGASIPERESLTQTQRDLAAITAMGLGAGSKRMKDNERERERDRDSGSDRENTLRATNSHVYDAFHSLPAPSSTLPPRPPAPISNDVVSRSQVFASTGLNGDLTARDVFSTSNSSGWPSSFTMQSQPTQTQSSDDRTLKPGNIGPVSRSASFPASSSESDTSPQSRHELASSGSVPLFRSANTPQPQQQSSRSTVTVSPSKSIATSYSSSRALSTGSTSPTDPLGFANQRSSTPLNSTGEDNTFVLGQGQTTEDAELARAASGLTVSTSTHQDMVSPQLSSPGSGGSSSRANASNAADQNPPINTLYVGNLPTTSSTSHSNSVLEESLRALFSKCSGYRKLCFRQKSNGPMCFVEFDDVQFATRALNELYGNSLNGLVKGGIRLSYSKNPLGVRNASVSTGYGSTSPVATNSATSMTFGLSNMPENRYTLPPSRHQSLSSAFSLDSAPGRPRQDSLEVRPSLSGFMLDGAQGRQRQEPEMNQHAFGFESSFGRPRQDSVDHVVSPTMYNNYPASPPSRFFSPPPSSGFNPVISSGKSMSQFGRGAFSGTSSFSPFASGPAAVSQSFFNELDENEYQQSAHSTQQQPREQPAQREPTTTIASETAPPPGLEA